MRTCNSTLRAETPVKRDTCVELGVPILSAVCEKEKAKSAQILVFCRVWASWDV